MAKRESFQMRAEAADLKRWRAEAKRRGMSLSALVRWAMDRPLREGGVEPIELPAEAAEALDRCAEVEAAVVRATAGPTVVSANADGAGEERAEPEPEEPVAESGEAVEGAEEPSPDGYEEPEYVDAPDDSNDE